MPTTILGGDMAVDVEAARQAIKEKVADRLGMSVAEAAHGIYRLVNANMIGATRVVTVQRGHDPRDFTPGGLRGDGRYPRGPHGPGAAHPPGDHPAQRRACSPPWA